jgi:hypothetical protein
MAPAKLVEEFFNSSTSFAGAITPVTPKFKSSHLLNSSTSFAGAMTPVTPKFKSSHLLNYLGVTGVMAPVKLVEEFNK